VIHITEIFGAVDLAITRQSDGNQTHLSHRVPKSHVFVSHGAQVRRICLTGCARLIACRISRVIFRRRATNYRALSWKMNYKDKACYASKPSCTCATSGDDLYRSLLTGQHVQRYVYKSLEIFQQIKRNLTTIRLLCRTCAAYVHGQHFKRDLY